MKKLLSLLCISIFFIISVLFIIEKLPKSTNASLDFSAYMSLFPYLLTMLIDTLISYKLQLSLSILTICIIYHFWSLIKAWIARFLEKNLLNIWNELSLFLDWVFKKKLLLISGSISAFILYILGDIYIKINIPYNSIVNNFSSYLPILLDYVLIESLFSWQFIVSLFAILLSIYYFREHVQKIIAIIVLLHIGVFAWTTKSLSNTTLPEKIYIETTGYPKVIQNNDHYYTLLGPNKEAYDLNKSLTAERCTNFNDANQSSAPEVYYSLIRRIGNDFDTYPSSAQTLEGNITYLNYNKSLNVIETLCSN